jgi:hypothetical protein
MKESKEDMLSIDKAPVDIFWPTETTGNDRLIMFTDDENAAKLSIKDKTYYSNIYMNVESDEEGEILSFNILDLFPNKDELLAKKTGGYHLCGDMIFIDKENNVIALNNESVVELGNKLFFAPKDLYLSIDLENGDIVFKNAPKNSDLHIIYAAFFLMMESDYEKIEPKKTVLDQGYKSRLNSITIDGYDGLTEEQRKNVDEILNKILYDNETANIDKFAEDVEKDKEPLKLKVQFNEDGTINSDAFVNQICPLYAERIVDMSKVIFDKNKIPVLNDSDIKNLTLMGFSKKDIKGLIDKTKDMARSSNEEMSDIIDKMESIKKGYDNSRSTCLTIISNKDFISGEYNQIIKNNYNILAMMMEYEKEYKRQQAIFKSAVQTLASLQTVSRQDIKKSIENKEFLNKHVFASIALFYKAMCSAKIIEDERGSVNNNYSVYNVYLKYVTKKIEVLDDAHLFNSVYDSFNPTTNQHSNIFVLFLDFLPRIIKIDDLVKAEKVEAEENIAQRVQSVIGLIYDLSYHPITLASRVYPEIVDNLAFYSDEKQESDYNEKRIAFYNELKETGWPCEREKMPDLNKIGGAGDIDIISASKLFRSYLDDDDTFDAIKGVLRIARLTSLNEYFKRLKNKSIKTNGDVFKLCIQYFLLARLASAIDAVCSGIQTVYSEEEKKEIEVNIDKNQAKLMLGKLLLETVSVILFLNGSLRLNNLMNDVLDDNKLKGQDAQSFFSVIINSLALQINILENIVDKGNGEIDISSILNPAELDAFGSEAVKMLYLGLKGTSIEEIDGEKKTVSRLCTGRKDVLYNSVEYTKHVIGLINNFIKKFIPAKE